MSRLCNTAGKLYNKNNAFIITKIIIIATVFIGLTFPRVSPADQSQNLTKNLSSPLPIPNFENIDKSLSEINQLEIINNITAPLNNIIRSFLNGGQDLVVPRLKSSLEGISDQTSRLNSQNTFSTMSIGEIIDKSKEAFILIVQILVAILETTLGLLKSILGFIS